MKVLADAFRLRADIFNLPVAVEVPPGAAKGIVVTSNGAEPGPGPRAPMWCSGARYSARRKINKM
jgi:hypothetical protein